jgi:hypothetical protein
MWRPEAEPSAFFQNGAREFTTTHWNAVVRAAEFNSAEANCPLDPFRPTGASLFARVCRHGSMAEGVQNLTLKFFTRLLEKNYLPLADVPRRGFRTFAQAWEDKFVNSSALVLNADKVATRRGASEFRYPLFDETATAQSNRIDFFASDSRYGNRLARWECLLVLIFRAESSREEE